MTYPKVSTFNISNHGVTTLDCQKQVRSWRLLRYLIHLLIPSCNRTFIQNPTETNQKNQNYYLYQQPAVPSPSTVTGTIFRYRRGKANFCLQTNSKSANLYLLIQLPIPTIIIAREMQGGVLRIVLESSTQGYASMINNAYSLLSMPLWTTYCNGRKAGCAFKRRTSKVDMETLRLMRDVIVGAGILNGKDDHQVGRRDYKDEIMYLRAKFERSCGSANSESFHLIETDERIGQELGIFFLRST